MQLGNRTNLPEASRAGGVSTARAVDVFAANVLPIIASVRAPGAGTLRAFAVELNPRRIETARGGELSTVQAKRVL